MTSSPSRLFLALPTAEVAHWCEVELTETLLRRIRRLDALRLANDLLEIQIAIRVKWKFADGYRAYRLGPFSRLRILQDCLIVEATGESKNAFHLNTRLPLLKEVSVLLPCQSGDNLYRRYHVENVSDSVDYLEPFLSVAVGVDGSLDIPDWERRAFGESMTASRYFEEFNKGVVDRNAYFRFKAEHFKQQVSTYLWLNKDRPLREST